MASIRRILSDDETQAAAPDPGVPTAAPPTQEDGVLILHEDMIIPDPAPAEATPVLPEPVVAPIERAFKPVPAKPVAEHPAPSHQLVADAAVAAAASSVDTLVRKLSQERSTAVHRGGPTIEDLVRDEVRPLLKEWLDLHLPPMVERLVRAELERVVGRVSP